ACKADMKFVVAFGAGRLLSPIFHRKVQGNFGRLLFLRGIMVDFFDIWQETLSKKSLPGRFIHVESEFPEYGFSDRHSFQHTAVQHATCLQQLMAAVRV
uniref:Mediator complex subunit 20 n=1 Tax=Aegilops tauschii subsp. strangulata TaxID=200361 RepID=A0A453KTG3_AEGTS